MNLGIFRKRSRPYMWTALKVIGILLIGCGLGLVASIATADMYRGSLIDRARTASQAISARDVAKLTGTERDLNSPIYQSVKARLIGLESANRDSRFVYLMGERSGTVYFYADSEKPTSDDYSPPGQPFTEASPALKNIFTTRHDLVEGPVHDRWGNWISALTPVVDPDSKQVIAVLGVDVPAGDYIMTAATVGIVPISVALFAAMMIVAVDMSRRRHQEMLDSQAQLMSAITHELNTPLTGIRWGAESLLKSDLDTTQRAMAHAIYGSVQHLQESVDDVMDLVRLGRNSQKTHFESVDMGTLISEVFTTQALPAEKKQVTLKLADDWPGVRAVCDSNKMKRLFNNLVSNAIKYTKPNTGVSVSYKHERGLHSFCITDAGIGIPESEQAKVLRGFYRASNAVDSGEHGTGMGLYLSKLTAEQHGGTLHFMSKEGKGTTVHVEISDHLRPDFAPTLNNKKKTS